MPTMATQTVKKFDGVTDIGYAIIQTGGSKERPAIWQATSIGTAGAHRPEIRYWVDRKGGDGQKCVVYITFHYPSLSTNSTTGMTSVVYKQKAKYQYELDFNAPQTDINEAVAQLSNLLDAVDVVSAVRNAQAFT